MIKITLEVQGMMCAHCEARMNQTLQAKFPSAQVSSSGAKNQTVILTAEDIAQSDLESLVQQAGYTLLGVKKEEQKKKGLFSAFKKQK